MANPLTQEEKAKAPDLAWECKEIADQAEALASFLKNTLSHEYEEHRVRVAESGMGGLVGDLILETPLGRLAGRFRYVSTPRGVMGILEIFVVKRTLQATTELEFVHAMAFDRNGRVTYDRTFDGSMDFVLSNASPQLPARTIAKILLTRQFQALTKP
ncbi:MULTISPECIES: hypothetical protein [unclassified Cupriavidus]|uniref:hypothetical protein n=1 Tax=unclassified Cupriavidus TaxID=2640874 RepID=UPI00313DA0B6